MKDFNNIRQWLLPLLNSRNMSVESLAEAAGLSRASIYFYLEDKCRPDSTNMKRMCAVLDVPFEDGLKQYSPRRVGRPPRLSS